MIRVFDPEIGDEEIAAVTDALIKGEISGTFGGYLPEFEEQFAEYCECRHGIAVSSGTAALHLAVAALDFGPEDEILCSASTNIATALSIFHNNATVVPIDSENLTWNLDLDLIESAITPATKAIIPVHLYGHPVDMERLLSVAKNHNLSIIEDCAEAHGATCRGKKVGSFGDMGCFSFYANKLMTTGEGGMVVTNDDALAEKLRLLRNLAFGQPRFLHHHAGYNFRMTGMQAALGTAQLKKLDTFIEQKRTIASWYNEELQDVTWITTPTEKDWAHNVYWMYAIVVSQEHGHSRDTLSQHLHECEIGTRTFFCPMHMQPCLQNSKRLKKIECPIAESLWNNGLYLPSSCNLSRSQVAHVCEAIRKVPLSTPGNAPAN